MSELLDRKKQHSPTGSRVTWIRFKLKVVAAVQPFQSVCAHLRV